MVKLKSLKDSWIKCCPLTHLINGVELQEEPLGNVVVESPDHPEGVVLDVQDGLGVLQQHELVREHQLTRLTSVSGSQILLN